MKTLKDRRHYHTMKFARIEENGSICMQNADEVNIFMCDTFFYRGFLGLRENGLEDRLWFESDLRLETLSVKVLI